MIQSMSELTQAREQLQRMQRAMDALRRDVLPVNPDRFSLMAEGPQDEIARLQADIDDFTRRSHRKESNALGVGKPVP